MDNLKSQDLSTILGLFDPWYVADVEINANALTIKLENKPQSRFSLRSSSAGPNTVTRKWRHARFGHMNTFIQVTMNIEELVELTGEKSIPFLGKEHTQVTGQLADTIRLAYSRQLAPELISELLGVETDLVEAEVRELEHTSNASTKAINLPLDSNPVWRNILTDHHKLTTRLLPLKLLLSRLKLEVSKNPDNASVIQESVSELRNFFLRNAGQLKAELDQVVPQSAQVAAARAPAQTPQKSKLRLPGTKNPLWQQILGGQLVLETSNTALRMNLAQSQRRFMSAVTGKDRLTVIRNMQLFFKHNARSLIPEIKQLTRLLDEQDSLSTMKLPPIEHEVWKRLLLDNQALNTEKINYRLLLSRLKADFQLHNNQASIERLRDFFVANARTMSDEITSINKLAANL